MKLRHLLIAISLFFLIPASIKADSANVSQQKLIHISQEEPNMIHFRSLMILGSVMRIKYKVLFEELNEDAKQKIVGELDDILYQLGTSYKEEN